VRLRSSLVTKLTLLQTSTPDFCLYGEKVRVETKMVATIPLKKATKLIEAAEQHAEEIGVPSVIAVSNSEGNLIAQHRMDGAWLPSVNISRNKAYTSAGLEMPTHELAEATEPGGPLYGLQTTDKGRIIIFGGGFPLEDNGSVVGAIGSSGGMPDEDVEIAQAGVERFDELVE
jgi:uncharacterized protein GlcG (DUF336 family)